MIKEKTRIRSVSIAMQILNLLGENPGGMLIKEISIELKLNLSTTYHQVNTLLDCGYLMKTNDDTYSIGYKIPFLYNAFLQSNASNDILNKYLQELSDITQETAYLGKEFDNEVILVGIVECPQAIKVKSLYVGYNLYPHARALPKAIFAYWPEEKLEQYFHGKPFEKLTDSTPSNLDELKSHLSRIRNQGYCLDLEGFMKGICCIAAPIFDASKKPIAVFCVTAPYERFNHNKQEYIDKVCEVSEKASRHLGYTVNGSKEVINE